MWQIEDHLWISGRPRLDKVMAAEITAVVTVSRKQPDPSVLAAIDAWRYCPVPDSFTGVPVVGLLVAMAETEHLLETGHTVLVHCLAGRNRSAAVAALVLRRHGNLTGSEALALVRARRPGAVVNPVTAAWLTALEKH